MMASSKSAKNSVRLVIANALSTNKVITLGGGHEVAWASFQGLVELLYIKRNNLHKAEHFDKDATSQYTNRK